MLFKNYLSAHNVHVCVPDLSFQSTLLSCQFLLECTISKSTYLNKTQLWAHPNPMSHRLQNSFLS